jgi:hypothetical protein
MFLPESCRPQFPRLEPGRLYCRIRDAAGMLLEERFQARLEWSFMMEGTSEPIGASRPAMARVETPYGLI